MKNSFGTALTVTLFGESHGEEIGAVADGFAPGIPIDEDYIASRLAQRRPTDGLSTARHEPDEYRIVSGVKDGYTTGAPLTVLIPNTDTRSGDYAETDGIARPSHADYTAYCKYHGYEDRRGGGHFSGRLTAPLVVLGAIAATALVERGVTIGTHIARLAGISDRGFGEDLQEDIDFLADCPFPVLDTASGSAMRDAILHARAEGDSVGGVLETAVTGLVAGVGEPWFDGVESVLARALWGIPAVKGIEFGGGFAMCDRRGSEVNDAFFMGEDAPETRTNFSGGIQGGITNGMPLLFRVGIKPTPTIAKEQETVNFLTETETCVTFGGRHDPAIVHRARAVVDAVTALVLCDLLAGRYGTDYLAEG